MINFEFESKTKIIFGQDSHLQIANIIKNYGFKNIALVYGQNSIKISGLYDELVNLLNQNNISYFEVSGVEANPKLSFVKKAINYLKEKNIDLILAVGGGSVIDCAKLISHAMYYENDPFDFNNNLVNYENYAYIPVGVILTISAAGSELSDSCVISNDEVIPFIKKGFNHSSNRPLFAILNPKLTYSVSKYQTGCGIVDIMMHTLERYMNVNDDCMLSENIAIGLLKTVLHYGKIAINEPNNYEARAELMLASSLSHNGLTGLGKKQFMRVHGLEHILSGCYDEVAHGAGLAILWPTWCKHVLKNKKAEILLTNLSKQLFDCDDALEGINKLELYFKEIGMPTRLSDLKLNSTLDIEKMALIYSNNKTKMVRDFIDLDYEAFIKIFESAR